MLSLFTVPKPFRGHDGIIQRNALQSWSRVIPDGEIILCGNDSGTEEAAIEFKTEYIPDVERNEYGTPLLNSVFDRVERASSYPTLCFLNADIILTRSFLSAVKPISLPTFVMLGQRWNLDVDAPIDFNRTDWEDQLRISLDRQGSIHPPSGSDYFVFQRGTLGKLPRFAVGRPGWDNWFIYNARKLGIPVVDATNVATVIHQNHDYAHIKHATDKTWEGPEAEENRRLIGGWQYIFNVRDASYLLILEGAEGTDVTANLQRNFRTLPVPALKACKKLNYYRQAGIRMFKRCFLP